VHHRFGRPETEVVGTGSTEIGFATGCAVLLRGDALRSVGLINESFFLYSEDVELCRRLREDGWRMVFRPDARVVHRRGQSSDPLRNLSVTMLRYWTRNRLLYLRSFERGPARLCALLYTALNTAGTLRRVARLRGADRRSRLGAVVRGVYEGVRLPRLPTAAPPFEAGQGATARR
jgi:GT2 family glycosyltransferase